MKDANYWIQHLQLTAHPEGGYFSEVYRSADSILPEGLPKRYTTGRRAGTSIYFLLNGEEFSAFHRLKSDEIWHFHTGSSATIYIIAPNGELTERHIGPKIETGEQFQVVIPSGHWFGARVNDPEGFILVGCTVSPGFEFEDFELADYPTLSAEFPRHKALIRELTKGER